MTKNPNRKNKLPYPDPSGRAKKMYCPNPNCGKEDPNFRFAETGPLEGKLGFNAVMSFCELCGIIINVQVMPMLTNEPKKEKEESLILTRTN